MTDPRDEAQDVKTVAEQITRYLRSHHNVADTLDGIAQWWIVRQRIYEERERVRQALGYLCEQGVVRKRVIADGGELYSLVVEDGDAQQTSEEKR